MTDARTPAVDHGTGMTGTPGRLVGPAMDRVAARLGVSTSQAYTVSVGAVAAVVLALLGLPGVFRGVDPTPFGTLASAPPAAEQPVSFSDQPAREPEPVAPALPALSPSAAPTGGSTGTPPGPANRPATGPAAPSPVTSTPPPSAGPATTTPPASAAPVAVLADVPAAPHALAVGASSIWVATDDGLLTGASGASELVELSLDGSERRRLTVDGQPSSRTRGLTGVAVAPDGRVVTVDASTSRVLVVDGNALTPLATIEDLAACGILGTDDCEPGLVDNAPRLEDVTVTQDGTVLVADAGQGIVWAVRAGAAEVLVAVDDRVPGEGPSAVAELEDGGLAIIVSARLATVPPGLAAVMRARRVSGAYEAPVLVEEFATGETPGDLVAGRSGRVYVTVPSSGVVADIGVDQGDRIDLDGGTVDPPFRAPTGIDLRDGALVVGDVGSGAADTDPPLLYTLAVTDRPVTDRREP